MPHGRPQGTPLLARSTPRYQGSPCRPCPRRQIRPESHGARRMRTRVNVNAGSSGPRAARSSTLEPPQDNYLLFIVISIFINYSYDP